MKYDSPWTDDEDAELKELQRVGHSGQSIADIMNTKFDRGYTRNSVIGRLFRLGEAVGDGKTYVDWSSKMVASLSELAEAGNMAGQIAGELSKRFPEKRFTASSVQQYARRLGIKLMGWHRIRRQTPKILTFNRCRPSDYKPQAPAVPPQARNVSLVDLGPRECRYATSEDSPHTFCGARTDAGQSWCDFHKSIVFQPPRKALEAAE